jgi:hypothetical protein
VIKIFFLWEIKLMLLREKESLEKRHFDPFLLTFEFIEKINEKDIIIEKLLGSMKKHFCEGRNQMLQYFPADNNDAEKRWVLSLFNENDTVGVEL